MSTPTNRANAKSFKVSPPNNSRAAMGSNTTREVLIERMMTWFIEVLTTSP